MCVRCVCRPEVNFRPCSAVTVLLSLLLFVCAERTRTLHGECRGHVITQWNEDFPSIRWLPRTKPRSPGFPGEGLGLRSQLTGFSLLSLFFHLGSLTGLELMEQGEAGWSGNLLSASHYPPVLGCTTMSIHLLSRFILNYVWGEVCAQEKRCPRESRRGVRPSGTGF